MNLRACLMTCSLLALFAARSLPAQDSVHPIAAQIDELLTRSYAADAPGAAVIVVHRGEVVFRKGYGLANAELGVAMKPEHIFRIGSITKQFTAIAILQLVEAGKVALDDDITKYVPEVQTGGQRITIAQLLTHTSGIPSFTDQAAWRAQPRKDMTLADELEFIKDKPLHFSPGTDWRYSNTGYRLLGAVVEKASGQTYADYVSDQLFKPAGMTSSSYDDTSRIIPHRIPGYSFARTGFSHSPFVSMTQPHGAGALLSSVDDLWKWDQALSAGKILNAKRVDEAFTSGRLVDGRAAGYGYGWTLGSIGGHPSAEHGGGIQGFATYALRVPAAGLFVAVLCNADNPRTAPGSVAVRIAKLFLADPPAAAVNIPPETLRSYAGVFRASPTQKFELAVDGERLVLKEPRGRSTPLDAVSATAFRVTANDTQYELNAGKDGPLQVRVKPRLGLERLASRVDEETGVNTVATSLGDISLTSC
ncbi:MAG: serine hydrolase domain-containing protein [Verrucomicrobiota bacterium]